MNLYEKRGCISINKIAVVMLILIFLNLMGGSAQAGVVQRDFNNDGRDDFIITGGKTALVLQQNVNSEYALYIYKVNDQAEVNGDLMVDFKDFLFLSQQWLNQDCNETNLWCHQCDFDQSGYVDINDLAHLAGKWLVQLGEGECELILSKSTPVVLEVIDNSDSIDILESTYDHVEIVGGTLVASATVNSSNASVFHVTDTITSTITVDSFPGCKMIRDVEVITANANDKGFQSRILFDTKAVSNVYDFGIFMPGLWYGDNFYAPFGAIGSYSENFAREDRFTAPFFAFFDDATGTGCGIIKAKGITTNNTIAGDEKEAVVVDSRITFGSLGFVKPSSPPSPMEVGWLYPGSEFERTYVSVNERKLKRYHPVEQSIDHSSGIIISLEEYNDYFEMAEDMWDNAHQYYLPHIASDIDLDFVYDALVDVLDEKYQDYPAQPMQGINGANLWTGVTYGRSIQMGFVEPQMRMALSMLAKGFADGNQGLLDKAEKMLDGWADISGEGLAHTIWDFPSANWTDDGAANKVFLRRQCEGHFHMIEAYNLCRDVNYKVKNNWYNWVLSFADWLVDNQNSDGSYYRKYNCLTGVPVERSKTATGAPIQFLCEVYEQTGDVNYLETAKDAANYIWDNYNSDDYYVGITIDNPNVIDKESSMFGLAGYLALYEQTRDPIWLSRAKRAARVLESWHYIVDIPMPLDVGATHWIDAENTAGISLISLGHSGADTYSSMSVYQFFKMYQLTGKARYLDMAKLILYNTKQPLDLDGSKGYPYPGFMSELWIFAPGTPTIEVGAGIYGCPG